MNPFDETNDIDDAMINFCVWHTGQERKVVKNSLKKYYKALFTDMDLT